jgi:hypothetical protein
MKDEAPLSARARELANQHPERAADLRAAADALDSAVGSLDPKRTLGCWARLRKMVCAITGEPLV